MIRCPDLAPDDAHRLSSMSLTVLRKDFLNRFPVFGLQVFPYDGFSQFHVERSQVQVLENLRNHQDATVTNHVLDKDDVILLCHIVICFIHQVVPGMVREPHVFAFSKEKLPIMRFRMQK